MESDSMGGFTRCNWTILGDATSSFVRLSSDVLDSLWTAAADRSSTESIPPSSQTQKKWLFDPSNDPTFLPLEIQLSEDTTLYASFNGGLVPENSGFVQVPGTILEYASRNNNRSCLVRLLPAVAYATQVEVEPSSVEDWELLQIHADLLEGGGLLQQITVIYLDQCLNICVPLTGGISRQEKIRVVVKKIMTRPDTSNSHWPGLAGERDEKGDDCMPKYALLARETEVIIAPKNRDKNLSATLPLSWSDPYLVVPGACDMTSQQLAVFQDALPTCRDLIQAIPGAIYVKGDFKSISQPTETSHIEWVEVSFLPANRGENVSNEKTGILRLLTCPNISDQCAVLHPITRWGLGVRLLGDAVKWRPLQRFTRLSLQEVGLLKVQPSYTRDQPAWLNPNLRVMEFNQIFQTTCPELKTELELPFWTVARYRSPDSTDGTHVFVQIVPKGCITVVSSRCTVKLESLSDFHELFDSSLNDIGLGIEHLQIPLAYEIAAMTPSLIFASTLKLASTILVELERHSKYFGLMLGGTGSGKTHSLLTLGTAGILCQNRLRLYLDCKRLQESTKTVGEILNAIGDIFRCAVASKRSLILFDDLDRIAPNLLGGNEGDPGAKVQGANPTAVYQAKLISDRILHLFEAANTGKTSTAVVGTCTNSTSIHSALYFENEASISMLDNRERFLLFNHLISPLETQTNLSLSESEFGQLTEGFCPRDLEKAASRVRRRLNTKSYSATEEILALLEDFVPMSHIGLNKAKRNLSLEWKQIGGLFDVKEKLESIVLKPIKYGAVYRRASMRLPRGILLFGPTGCGKSCLVPALAQLCKFPLISCKGPEVLDKYIGASEAKIRELFKRAASVAPSIIFLDEMDSLAPRRGSDHTGVTDRVVNQLLTFLDGVEETTKETVYIIGASSRPDKIDPALLRPGRLEKHLYIGRPTTDEEWLDLLQKISSSWNLAANCRDFLLQGGERREILDKVRKMEYLCPADIKAAMDTAQLNAIHRLLRTKEPDDIVEVKIEITDVQLALEGLQPCMRPDDARLLDGVYRRYQGQEPPDVGAKQGKSFPPGELRTTLK